MPHLSSLTEVVGYVETRAAGIVWLATARPERLIDRGWPEGARGSLRWQQPPKRQRAEAFATLRPTSSR